MLNLNIELVIGHDHDAIDDPKLHTIIKEDFVELPLHCHVLKTRCVSGFRQFFTPIHARMHGRNAFFMRWHTNIKRDDYQKQVINLL